MEKVISIMPKWRFEAANVSLPQGWDIDFINPASEQELIALCQGAGYLLVPPSFSGISATALEKITSLKLIQMIGTGFDAVDTKAAAAQGIVVANAPGQNAGAVAEHTVGCMIFLQRKMLLATRAKNKGKYQEIRKEMIATGLHELNGSNIGLIGMGTIARRVAKILAAFGASVSYYARHRQPEDIERELAITYQPLEKLLADKNIISIHISLNPETRGFIGEPELRRMSKGTLLINTARGEIMDQATVAQFLENGHLGGVATDVLAPEPPSDDHPLLSLSSAVQDKLLVSPHTAGVTIQAVQKNMTTALKNVMAVMAGQPPEHVVNMAKK